MPPLPRQSAPNYTNAALIMGLINLLWIFGVLLVSLGLPVVLLTALGVNHLISVMAARRNTRP